MNRHFRSTQASLRRRSPMTDLLRGSLLLGLLAASALSFADAPVRVEPLFPEESQLRTTRFVTKLLTAYHYKHPPIDDELSRQIFDRFIDGLDPNRSYFLASDMENFEQYRVNLDDALLGADLRAPFTIFNRYQQRVQNRVAYSKALIDQEFDFTIDEEFVIDRTEEPWPATQDELNEIWRKRIKNDWLNLKLADKEAEDIHKTLYDRYDLLGKRMAQRDSEDVFNAFLNSFATAIEPHTAYLSPRTAENFRIRMSLSLEGIGAVLQRENDYTMIQRIVPGGPADLEGTLHAGDRILGVAQDDREMVDVIGWRLDDVVELIRGDKGTVVRLEILAADASIDSAGEIVAIMRNEVRLEEQAAQKSVIEFTANDANYKVGVIRVPAFYMDFAARQQHDPNYRSTTRDVRKLIAELEEEGVDGLVIDLRENSGGSLTEAMELTGLFIDQGPVVQVRTSDGRIKVERDPNPGVVYTGTMAVLVDRFSASASEIFAGAMQDYGRALIVGEPTFGKGTVQQLIDLDRLPTQSNSPMGQLKVTTAQFFRISGSSTQNKGVVPDIIFPTVIEGEEYGESALDNALPWAQVEPADYEASDRLQALLETATARHAERIAHDEDFLVLAEDLEYYEQNRDRTSISLLESKRQAERDELEARRARRNSLRTASAGGGGSGQTLASAGGAAEDANPTAEATGNAADLVLIDPETGAEVSGTRESELENDFVLDEAARVLGDLIDLLRRSAAVS